LYTLNRTLSISRIGEVHHLEQHCKNLEGELDQVI